MGNNLGKKFEEQYSIEQVTPPSDRFAVPKNLDLHKLEKLIRRRRLAPFSPPLDDPAEDSEQCPICLMYYTDGLNICKDCGNKICTECFCQVNPRLYNLGINDYDPNILFSNKIKCPFCKVPRYIVFFRGKLSTLEKQKQKEDEQKVILLNIRKQQTMKKLEEQKRKELEMERKKTEIEEREKKEREEQIRLAEEERIKASELLGKNNTNLNPPNSDPFEDFDDKQFDMFFQNEKSEPPNILQPLTRNPNRMSRPIVPKIERPSSFTPVNLLNVNQSNTSSISPQVPRSMPPVVVSSRNLYSSSSIAPMFSDSFNNSSPPASPIRLGNISSNSNSNSRNNSRNVSRSGSTSSLSSVEDEEERQLKLAIELSLKSFEKEKNHSPSQSPPRNFSN